METLANFSQTQLKPYSALTLGDEIFAYCGSKWQRCQILRIEREGGFVRLRLRSAASNRSGDDHLARFCGDALVEVFEKSPTKQLAIERYSDAILSLFGRDHSLMLSSLAIVDRLKERHNIDLVRSRVNTVCNHLAQEGRLKRRGERIRRYRLALPVGVVNFPVVEFWEKPSQKLGWIIDWKLHRATGTQQPIVRFTTGEERFSQDAWLDPAQAEHLATIEIAQQAAAGTLRIPIPVPEWLLLELRQGWNCRKGRNEALQALAIHLGYLPPDSSFSGAGRHQARNKAIDYLDRYYPYWNAGNLYRVG